jgi:uncharacterized protein involved in exopolysaccharide biosynthesis
MDQKNPTPENLSTPHTVGWQAPLVDLAVAVLRRKWILVLCTLVAIGLGGLQYLRTPTTYRSSSVVLLMSREKPIFDVSVDAGTLETTEDAAKRESTGMLMLPANPDLYHTLLKSRSVLQGLVSQFQDRLAMNSIGQVRSEELIGSLRSMIKLESSEEGIMTITVTSHNPQLSADLANAMVEAGEQASKQIERQLLNQQVMYIEQTLLQAEETLKSEMQKLKSFAQTHHVVDPVEQASDRLRQIRETSMQRDDFQRQLEARRVSWTDRDTTIQQLIRKITLCDQRIAELEESIVGEAGLGEYGALLIDHGALIKHVDQQRDLVVSLTAQANVLRIRATQPAGNIAIIRPADPDSRPAGPSRKRFLMLSVGLGLFVGLALILVMEQWQNASEDPYIARKMLEINEMIPCMILGFFNHLVHYIPSPTHNSTSCSPSESSHQDQCNRGPKA